jgi:DNA mismatch repair protein MutL
VGFSFSANDRRLLTSPPEADLKDRVAQALGREVHPHLLAFDGRRGDVRVHGYVTSPDHSGATSQKIQLFVNRRAIRDRALTHAVGRAFANVLPPGRYPAAVVFIDLPLDRVDVNVHPQKLEVRFAEPREVAEAIVRVISDALRPAPWLAGKPSLPWPAGFPSSRPAGPFQRVAEEEVRFVPATAEPPTAVT